MTSIFTYFFKKKENDTTKDKERWQDLFFLALIKELQDMGSHPNVFSYFYIFIFPFDEFPCLSVCLFVCLSACYFWLWYFQSLSFVKLLSFSEKEVYSKVIWPNLVPLQIFFHSFQCRYFVYTKMFDFGKLLLSFD